MRVIVLLSVPSHSISKGIISEGRIPISVRDLVSIRPIMHRRRVRAVIRLRDYQHHAPSIVSRIVFTTVSNVRLLAHEGKKVGVFIAPIAITHRSRNDRPSLRRLIGYVCGGRGFGTIETIHEMLTGDRRVYVSGRGVPAIPL